MKLLGHRPGTESTGFGTVADGHASVNFVIDADGARFSCLTVTLDANGNLPP